MDFCDMLREQVCMDVFAFFFPWVSFNFGQLCMALLHKNTERCALTFKTSDPTKLFLTLFYFA